MLDNIFSSKFAARMNFLNKRQKKSGAQSSTSHIHL